MASKSILFSSQAGAGAEQRVPYGALPMAGRPGRAHLPKYFLHKLVKIFLLLQILPNTQILSYAIVLFLGILILMA